MYCTEVGLVDDAEGLAEVGPQDLAGGVGGGVGHPEEAVDARDVHVDADGVGSAGLRGAAKAREKTSGGEGRRAAQGEAGLRGGGGGWG